MVANLTHSGKWVEAENVLGVTNKLEEKREESEKKKARYHKREWKLICSTMRKLYCPIIGS